MELEVWGVGPEPDQEELGGDSVLNVDPEAQVRRDNFNLFNRAF